MNTGQVVCFLEVEELLWSMGNYINNRPTPKRGNINDSHLVHMGCGVAETATALWSVFADMARVSTTRHAGKTRRADR